ncbi:2173_t:CDS:10 [Funneliformis geosporum]|nr:2173_t:CDS:10 [Funneliformis geosporum]
MSHDNVCDVDDVGEELLELFSPNQDYVNESYNQNPLEYNFVQEEKHAMNRVTKGEDEGYHVSKTFTEEWIDTDGTNECLVKVLSEISDLDPVTCNNLENVFTIDLTLEEPRFPKNMQLENNDQNPIIKSLPSKFTRFNEPEPFLDVQTEDFCISREHLAILQELEQKDETISLEGLRSNDKCLEEPRLPIKETIICVQDAPNSISENVSLVRQEIKPSILTDKTISVIEETGVRAPLEILDDWEGVSSTNVLDESMGDDSKEDEVIPDVPTISRLEPISISVKHDHLKEVHRRKQTSSANDDDAIMTDHVFPENKVQTPPEQVEYENLQKDLDNFTHVELGDKWPMVARMKSMDVSEPARSGNKCVNFSRITNFLIKSDISTCDFGLHWNPFKNAANLGILQIVVLDHTPHNDDLTKIIQEGSACLNSDNFLALIDVKSTNKDNEIHLRSRKEKKRGEATRRSNIKKSGLAVAAPRDKPATSSDISMLFSIGAYDNHSLSYSRRTDTPSKSSNQKKRSVKQNVSARIQPLLRQPTARSRNVDNPIPDIKSWIRIGNENAKAPLTERINDSISNLFRQDRVTQWLSDQRNKNDDENFDDIEVVDLTLDAELPALEIPTPEILAPEIPEPVIPAVLYSSETTFLAPEIPALHNSSETTFLAPEIPATVIPAAHHSTTSPFFNENSTPPNEQYLFDTTLFSNSFSATRSIDDFLLLRGTLQPGRRREGKAPSATSSHNRIARKIVTPDITTSTNSHVKPVTNQNVSILNKNSFVSISKAILERLPKPTVSYKYIASARILPNRGLLTALKSRNCKIELIERDFEYMRPLLSERESDAIHVDVDIIIDERTGAIFYPLNMLAQSQTVSKLVQTVNRLRLKYTNLYLILEAYTWNNRPASSNTEYIITTYPFTLPILRATSELQTILMCSNCDDVKIMFSLCEEMSAKLLRMIGNRCAIQCDEQGIIIKRGWKNQKHWESRDWMAIEESLHERFLSCFTPFVNPFTAQIILTATTLLQFFQMSHAERYDLVGGWIGGTRLEMFDEIIHEPLSGNANEN